MSERSQELVALSIVALAAVAVLYHLYRKYLAYGLANWLLRHGKVKLAMKVNPRFRGNPSTPSGSDDDCCG